MLEQFLPQMTTVWSKFWKVDLFTFLVPEPRLHPDFSFIWKCVKTIWNTEVKSGTEQPWNVAIKVSEHKLTTGQQKILSDAQRAIVWRRFNLQQFAHQRVNMDAVKWLGEEVLFKVRSKSPEDSLHVHLFIVVAMITFVDINNESLLGNRRVVMLRLDLWLSPSSHGALTECAQLRCCQSPTGVGVY